MCRLVLSVVHLDAIDVTVGCPIRRWPIVFMNVSNRNIALLAFKLDMMKLVL
jgi:hypothetical protein